jgi:hypothetical protein
LKKLPENNPTFVHCLFRDLLKKVKQEMQTNPNDYIRLNIDHPSLDSPIWIEFTQTKNLTEEKILNKIEAVQQSKKEFLISEGGTQLDFFHVQYPEGSGGAKINHLHLDKENFKKNLKEPSCRSTIPGILCAYPVPSSLPVFMPRNLKFPTPTLTKNGNGCD